MLKSMMQRFQKMFASADTDRNGSQQAFLPELPPGHHEAVREYLERAGIRIEQRSTLPVLMPNQFDLDLAARRRKPRYDPLQGPEWLR